MADSTRYFQLTPDILVEYNYYDISNIQEQAGDVEYMIDFDDAAYVVKNSYCSTNTFFWTEQENGFVVPVNKSESRFVQCKKDHNYIWNGADLNIRRSANPIFQSVDNTDHDLLCDSFRLHFTSRNYLGNSNYDGFILTVHIYDKIKNKVGLLSQYIRKTDEKLFHINENPMLINQKLYTLYMDFTLPNAYALLNWKLVDTATNHSESILKEVLFKYDMMDNSPVIMSIYGVKSINVQNNYEYYNSEKLNSIYIPIIDKSNGLSIQINEAEDGDYFEIYPQLNNKNVSFSDFIYNISIDENGEDRSEYYIVFHELTLTEHYTDYTNALHNDVTHREQFIINATHKISNDGNVDTEISESELERKIFYRPVLRKTGKDMSFTIDVKTYIINTFDNTTIVIRGSLDYPDPNKPEQSIKKYGKKMNKIYLGEVPAKVNVYNRKPDIDIDGVKITNASSNVKIENHQHSVIGFIECANVGVAIEQVPKESLE